MALADDFDVSEFVDVMLAEFPGMADNPAFLEKAAAEVWAGNDPEVPASERSKVVAELRRRALKSRNLDFPTGRR